MTLIARLRFGGGAPLYLGDALLSAPRPRQDRLVSIPAAAEINSKLPDDAWGVITGLKQKLNLLNGGDLLVAWAGSSLQARTALREMEEAAARGAIKSADFISVLQAKPENELDNITLLGTRVSPDGKGGVNLAQWAFNCPQEEIHDVDCRVAGSGAEAFNEMLPNIIQKSEGSARPAEQAYKTAMIACGLLISNEFDHGGNLVQMWGGAFEAAYVSDVKIEKFSDTLHTFWWLEPINEKQLHLRMLTKFAKYSYLDDVLFVDVLEMSPDQGPSRSVHAIAPLLSSGLLPAYPNNFTYLTMACHVRLPPSPEGVERVTMIRHRYDPMLHLEVGDGRVGMRVSVELFDLVRSKIQPMCELEIV